jgi:hypothetical protein
MDKKHIIDGTRPRSADILVCGLRRLLVAGSRLVISRTTRPLRHGTGKSREPAGWKAYATRTGKPQTKEHKMHLCQIHANSANASRPRPALKTRAAVCDKPRSFAPAPGPRVVLLRGRRSFGSQRSARHRTLGGSAPLSIRNPHPHHPSINPTIPPSSILNPLPGQSKATTGPSSFFDLRPSACPAKPQRRSRMV